jgi:alpha-galactosidase
VAEQSRGEPERQRLRAAARVGGGRADVGADQLADWYVDAGVWPDGLHPLIERVRGLGMQFGLWVEPEMVNPDSDLYRAHPEWVLGAARLPPSWRHQQVLNLAHPDAYAYILERLDALLTEYDIAYLKWDHNRDVVDAPVHAQTLAVYRLLDELRARHPGVEIESCSSGGARVDLGILARTDRVWGSDSNDALERQHIQRWTALLLPGPGRPCRRGCAGTSRRRARSAPRRAPRRFRRAR